MCTECDMHPCSMSDGELEAARSTIAGLEERLTQLEQFLADTERSYDIRIGALVEYIQSLEGKLLDVGQRPGARPWL